MNVHAPEALQASNLESVGEAAWDRFVDQCEEATFFHRAGWQRVIKESFGHKTYYLCAVRGRRIEGVLPLVHIRHPFFGNFLSSTAFCVYGGPAAVTSAARELLNIRAQKLAAQLDVDHLEYRLRVPDEHDGWHVKSDLYATFRKALDPDVEKNMLAIPRKQRAMVRKGIKLGLRSEIDSEPDRLYRVYAESVRNLGTPVFPKRYFYALQAAFADCCENLIVVHQGRPVSAVMSFYFRDEVLPYYGGGTEAARSLAANDFMYWEVMRRACERQCRIFDFGRSKRGTGAFNFKTYWGFTPESLHYAYLMRRGSEPPNLNPLNPKFRIFIALWKRLPLPIANLIGPHIVRNLG